MDHLSTRAPIPDTKPVGPDHVGGLGNGNGCRDSNCGMPPTTPDLTCRDSENETLRLLVPSMDCSNEERAIRAAIDAIPGIRKLAFDLTGHALEVDAPDAAWPSVIAAIDALGFETRSVPMNQPAVSVEATVVSDACCSARGNSSPPAPSAGATAEGLGRALLLRIPDMDCPTEEGQIRKALKSVPGIRRLQFDLPARSLAIDAPASSWDRVVDAIQAAGFRTEIRSTPPTAEDTARTRRAEFVRLGASLAVAVVAEAVQYLAPSGLTWQLVGMGIAAAAIFLSGLSVLRKGLGALVRGQLNINALMSVAVIGAFVFGQWPEAAMVMSLYALAELIEARSVDRARNAIAGLLSLSPQKVEVRRPDGTWSIETAEDVAIGAMARVKPGERFALDGRVVVGRSTVDQSSVTGESIPVDKAPGDEVFAGTINQGGGLEFEVTRAAANTVLARIIHSVEEAQSQRAPTQRFVDRFAEIYTPAVFVLALVVALGAPLVLGWPWLVAVYKALVLLVIACPCALVISTPVTVVSGLAAGARRGILIKGGAYLEQARELTVLGLDKTGTLTRGEPKLVTQRIVSDARPEAEAQTIARSLAARSDHPVSKAVADGLQGELLEVKDFRAEPGKGIEGTVEGRSYMLGNRRWITGRVRGSPALEALMHEHESRGRTLSVLADEREVLAIFAVADTTRESSAHAVAELKTLGIRTVMLTGDNLATARAIAREVGIDDVRADLLPGDKQAAIAELSRGGRRVGMVGDGVNDSPSLAAAHIGFSMGGAGTDIAKEAADVLIMNDDLRKVPDMIRLSRRTHRVLWQNIAVALAIKAVFFLWASVGDASMWMAVFADMGASLLVVFNGMRLLRARR